MTTDQKGRRRVGSTSIKLSAYDHALVKVKKEGGSVTVELALPLSYTNDEGQFVAKVCHVDTYAIQFELADGNKPWVSKAFIVSVLPDA